MEIRNRIREYRLVKASELRHHPRNWRKHPPKQRKAFRALLEVQDLLEKHAGVPARDIFAEGY